MPIGNAPDKKGDKYPDLFAAAYLVTEQWNPDLVAPLAKKKLWIMVPADDLGAFPGENAITERFEQRKNFFANNI